MWALLAAVLLAGSAALEPPGALRCRHERCRYVGRNSTISNEFGVKIYTDHFDVEGNIIQINQTYKSNVIRALSINCNGASVLESPALPRASPARDAWRVTLENCPPTGSLVDTLAALNVKCYQLDVSCYLELRHLPASPALAAKHFAGLERLYSLSISADTRASPNSGFLSPLLSLYELEIRNVTLPDGELDAPPPSLEFIMLSFTGVERLPEAVYSSSVLRWLTILSEGPLDAVSVPPKLSYLQLQSTATKLRLDAAPSLDTLLMTNWVEPQPPRLMTCDKLRKVHLTAPAMRALPNSWLANCSRLEELVMEEARHLTAVQQQFTNMTLLTRLALKGGALETVPEGLLNQTSKLKSLELDGNRLKTLPGNLLWDCSRTITMLNLSSNDLDERALNTAVPDDVPSLLPTPPLYYLAEVNFGHNPRIGDICDESGYSVLRNLTRLKTLVLSGTGVPRICRDWREGMAKLQLLDLSGTKVTELSFEDLQFKRTVKSEVRLLGAPVGAVRVTREDYNKTALTSAEVTVLIDAPLQCDCRMYWARRALDPSLHALDGIRQLRCAGGGLLRDVPLEDMVCARPEECAAAELPPACACAVWADDDPDHDPRLVRVLCENASLTRVPRLHPRNDSTERLYELQLAHNQIADLQVIDLQDNIRGLNLRNNSLRRVDEETATKLGNVSGMLWLAGNPLECDCSAAPLLHALHFRAPGHTDLDTITCHNGNVLLHKVPITDCLQPHVAWLAGVLVTLFVFVLAVVIFLSSRSRRFFALAVLHRWGFMWHAAEPKEDESRRYDAFVTFSHVDSDVVRELMARLEPPYRLCVHHRDWIPGHYIAEQIADSVRESRRTVALVSRHFLASKWTRAEFREAHTAAMLDARPRLIVVLLEEPAALPLDKELQRYISTQTYLRWGDPWFWDKMAVALPPPRPATPPPSRVSRQPDSTTTEPAIELSPVSHPATTDSGS